MVRAPASIGTADASLRFERMRDALRRGVLVDDRDLDAIYPSAIRRASAVHWTPVDVAVKAARLLATRPGARLLDIGSGVGKFCIVAAAAVEARVAGVEQRARLVEIGELAAERFGVDVTFTRGTLDDCDPRDVDGVYLFNPFAENLCQSDDRIDGTVELSELRFVRDVAAARRFLRATRAGTRVVTYCGFGGEMPSGYVRLVVGRRASSLELWEQTKRFGRHDGAHAR